MKITRRVLDNLNESSLNEDINSNLDFLIKDEEEAIAGYNKVLNTLQPLVSNEQFRIIQETLTHIIDEEDEHIKELKQLKTDLGISK